MAMIKKNALWSSVVAVHTHLGGVIAPINIGGDLQIVDNLIPSYPSIARDDWQLNFDPRCYGGAREG